MNLFLGLHTALADAVAEPVRIAATRTESRVGLYVAGLALAAAVAISGVLFVRRRKG
jgi:hypothetical protein